MESRLDLTLLPVSSSPAIIQPQIDGLYVGPAARHPARGRAADQLALYLPQSNLPGDSARGMLHLSNLYYKTSGTVTSALRSLAEEANHIFLELGAKGGTGNTENGVPFCSMVLRHSDAAEPLFYLAHCGPIHLYHLSAQGARHIFDPQRSSTGLGIHRSAPLLFHQFELHPHDFILLFCGAPAGWDSAQLRAFHRQGLDKTYHGLLNLSESAGLAGPPFLLAYAQPGGGILQVANPLLETQAVKRSPEPKLQDAEPAPTRIEPILPPLPPRPEAIPTIPLPVTEPQAAPAPVDAPPSPESPPALSRPARSNPLYEVQQRWKDTLQEKVHPLRVRLAQILRKITPAPPVEGLETPRAIPTSLMIFIAVAVPVVVVAVTSMLYLQRGLTSLNQNYFEQAQSLAVQAISENDLDTRRKILEQSLNILEKAESYQITTESKSLRNYINTAVDEIEGTVRLNFQPILSGRLPGSADIQRMILVGDDMYLFNAAAGNVLRARRNEQTYEIDPEFYCGPGAKTGPFVDATTISWTPPSKSPTITGILGLDANGNLQYCFPEEETEKVSVNERDSIISAETLISPDLGWTKPQAMINAGGTLYILDPPANAIWLYAADENGKHGSAPTYLFTNKPQIQDTQRMIMYRERMFLLHSDGRITQCYLDTGYNTPTRCDNPAMFTDTVKGSKAGIPQLLHPDGSPILFKQIIISPPPDPSLYMLEAPELSAYHFSLGLALQRRFRAQQDLVDTQQSASAIVIGNDRTIYMAVGANLYAAILP